MDSPYDMNKSFTPEQSRSQIWTLLASVGLTKYMEVIVKAGIDFHAFCNLTREDMRRVGIVNYADQTRLIDVISPMRPMYRDLDGCQVHWVQIAKNMSQSSEMLAGSLVEMNHMLQGSPVCHSLVDYDTPSCRAIQVLLDLVDSRINLMDRDLREILRKAKEQPTAQPSRKKVLIGLLALAAAVATPVAVWYFKTPGQVLGIRFLAK